MDKCFLNKGEYGLTKQNAEGFRVAIHKEEEKCREGSEVVGLLFSGPDNIEGS